MKHTAICLAAQLLMAFTSGCTDEGASKSGVSGQVVSICVPSIPPEWTPPPREEVSTIVILDKNQLPVMEAKTDEKGRFNILIPPGTYFVQVKESPVRNDTGPYSVKEGEVVQVAAQYQCAIR